MAATEKSNLIIPEILAETVRTGFSGVVALNGSPAAVVQNGLPGDKRGGDTVKIPRFSNIGEFEDVAEGAALTPVGLTMAADETTVIRTGKAFSMSEWARLAAAYADPYAEASRQIVAGVQRRIDKALIDAAKLSGSDLTAMTNDISALSGGANKITLDAIVDTRKLWADEADEVVLMGVHSAVLASLYKLKDSTGKPLLTDAVNGGLPSFMGIPIKVSDRFAPTGDVYSTYLFKRGAVACWVNNTPTIKTDEDILKDEHFLAINMYLAAVRYSKVDGGTKCGVGILKHKV